MKYCCKYGVPQDEACEDDCCQDCEFRKVYGKNIVCEFLEWNEGEKVQFD